jgi:Holliday junction resolvase
MGKSQRDKGKRGERDFLNQLGELLGDRLARNLNQSDGGGCDCISIPGYAIEVKRHESLSVGSWWKQAQQQAQAAGAVPVLAYRQSRKPWVVVVPLERLTGKPSPHTVQLSLEGFAEIIRQSSTIQNRPDSPARADLVATGAQLG